LNIKKKEKDDVFWGGYGEFLDDTLTINLNSENKSNPVSITVGHDFYDSKEIELKTGHRVVVEFDKSYAIKLLKTESATAKFSVLELPQTFDSYIKLFDNTISKVEDSDDSFSNPEILELRAQLQVLTEKMTKLTDLHEEELTYIKAALELLNKKLDEGSKSGWKQAAYGVAASIACAISPEQAQQVISISHEAAGHISNAVTMLSNKT
jgi:hypothetical protein